MFILIGFIIYLFFTFLLHCFYKEKHFKFLFIPLSIPKQYLILELLSPSYLAASIAKKNIKNIFFSKSPNFSQFLAINYWNKLNLFFSIFFTILAIVITYLFQEVFVNLNYLYFIYLYFIYFYFICFRVFSRSVELIGAFFLDIIDLKTKNLFLNSNDRILLATRSYIEIIFNFTTLNYLASVMYKNNYILYENIFTLFKINPNIILNDTNIQMDFIVIFIKSFAISTLSDATVDSLFSVLQVLTSLVLVLFALAGYLNNKGDNK